MAEGVLIIMIRDKAQRLRMQLLALTSSEDLHPSLEDPDFDFSLLPVINISAWKIRLRSRPPPAHILVQLP